MEGGGWEGNNGGDKAGNDEDDVDESYGFNEDDDDNEFSLDLDWHNKVCLCGTGGAMADDKVDNGCCDDDEGKLDDVTGFGEHCEARGKVEKGEVSKGSWDFSSKRQAPKGSTARSLA